MDFCLSDMNIANVEKIRQRVERIMQVKNAIINDDLCVTDSLHYHLEVYLKTDFEQDKDLVREKISKMISAFQTEKGFRI